MESGDIGGFVEGYRLSLQAIYGDKLCCGVTAYYRWAMTAWCGLTQSND